MKEKERERKKKKEMKEKERERKWGKRERAFEDYVVGIARAVRASDIMR